MNSYITHARARTHTHLTFFRHRLTWVVVAPSGDPVRFLPRSPYDVLMLSKPEVQVGCPTLREPRQVEEGETTQLWGERVVTSLYLVPTRVTESWFEGVGTLNNNEFLS